MKVSKRQLTNLSISIDEKSENQRNQEESIHLNDIDDEEQREETMERKNN